nr:unnamed protein product [Spirometra erinaceieuropaei]
MKLLIGVVLLVAALSAVVAGSPAGEQPSGGHRLEINDERSTTSSNVPNVSPPLMPCTSTTTTATIADGFYTPDAPTPRPTSLTTNTSIAQITKSATTTTITPIPTTGGSTTLLTIVPLPEMLSQPLPALIVITPSPHPSTWSISYGSLVLSPAHQ